MSGPYNAAVDLLGRNLGARADKTAFIDADGRHSYAEVAQRAERAGAALSGLGLAPGSRIVLVLQDGVDFVTCFLGAIRSGLVPIPLNTLFPAEDLAYILSDSGAGAAVVSEPLAAVLEAAVASAGWSGQVVVSGQSGRGRTLASLLADAPIGAAPHDSQADDIAFWLYSSGSTGRPKGALHRHRSLALTAELFARRVFGFEEGDVVFSAAKLFFAYGLGNALTFPMYAGATSVLFPGRVTPEVVGDIVGRSGVTVFCGVPTLYASLLASPQVPARGSALRLCLSAGEPLPAEVGRAWRQTTGVEIVDGIGSTEMLHIFLSNRPGQIRDGATGTPVPGYEVRLAAEDGGAVRAGEIGELYVRGPTMAAGYWNQPEKTEATFADGWMRTGDKFEQDETGIFHHRGRSDDMLKVSGIWVSPVEVEAALAAHGDVLEAAVIGVPDASGLVKSKAFVVLKPSASASPELAEALQQFVKSRLAPYKYPRMIEFLDDLPKTATGKLRRHALRDMEAAKQGADRAAAR
ncbi:MAG TPA: benzoate-CoA ligase family protein [Caulobacteraceae bacterium]|nr:benzoate-CoA ligase family protein [Caulobacteraceae bacterium]